MGPKILCTILSALVAVVMGNDSEPLIVQSNGQFTTKLYKVLSKNSGNVFFSPLSAHNILALSYLGSSGSTQEAFVKSLALPDKKTTVEGYKVVSGKLASEDGISLYLANKIYVAEDAKLNSEFSTTVKENFNAEVENINFAANAEAAKTINSWVEQKTANKIKDMLSQNDLNPATKVVLVNAIYFKGGWDESFDASNTRTEPFYVNENKKIDVQMMHNYQEEYGYKYDQALKASILKMKFENPHFSMVIILPDERYGIKDLEAKLQTVDLTNITDGIEDLQVHVALPKFKINAEIDLQEALEELGLGEIFTNSANFSDLLQNKLHLEVDKIIQKTLIEVNEEGAEAASATRSINRWLSARIQSMKIDFIADHPFMLLMMHDSGPRSNIIFAGRISDPVY